MIDIKILFLYTNCVTAIIEFRTKRNTDTLPTRISIGRNVEVLSFQQRIVSDDELHVALLIRFIFPVGAADICHGDLPVDNTIFVTYHEIETIGLLSTVLFSQAQLGFAMTLYRPITQIKFSGFSF